MTENEEEKIVKALNLIKVFNSLPTEEHIIDAITININLYKAKKINALNFGAVLGAATASFMDRIIKKADEDAKLHKAQPNPRAN